MCVLRLRWSLKTKQNKNSLYWWGSEVREASAWALRPVWWLWGEGTLTFQKTLVSVPSFPRFFFIPLGLHTFCSWSDLVSFSSSLSLSSRVGWGWAMQYQYQVFSNPEPGTPTFAVVCCLFVCLGEGVKIGFALPPSHSFLTVIKTKSGIPGTFGEYRGKFLEALSVQRVD